MAEVVHKSGGVPGKTAPHIRKDMFVPESRDSQKVEDISKSSKRGHRSAVCGPARGIWNLQLSNMVMHLIQDRADIETLGCCQQHLYAGRCLHAETQYVLTSSRFTRKSCILLFVSKELIEKKKKKKSSADQKKTLDSCPKLLLGTESKYLGCYPAG